MVLDKPAIPYSLRVGGEWGRIIHNNQQPVCIECSELGHTRRNCPKIRLRVCKLLGHMSYNCVEREEQEGEEQNDAEPEVNPQQPEATDVEATVTGNTGIQNTHANSDAVNKVSQVDSQKVEMEYEDRAQNLKRQHVTDSDSDKSTSVRRPRLKPVPNLLTRKKAEKKSAKATDKPPS